MFKAVIIVASALCAITIASPVPPDVEVEQRINNGPPRSSEAFFLPKLPLPQLPKLFPDNPEGAQNLPAFVEFLRGLLSVLKTDQESAIVPQIANGLQQTNRGGVQFPREQ